MTGEHAGLGDLVAATRAAGHGLRSAPQERVIAALATAARRLVDPGTVLGREARELLPKSTGLTSPMVAWGLETTLGAVTEAALLAVANARPPHRAPLVAAPAGLAVVILAGNLFTAAVRALFVPLACRVPVVAKASSRDDVLPRLLALALSEADPELGEALAVVAFPGGDRAREDVLLQQADVVSVYGSSHTLTALAARTPASCRFFGHGHGVGVVFVPRAALRAATLEGVLRAVALDVAAYDQRGCLSPQAVFVEGGGEVSAREFARALAEVGLAEQAGLLPRGALPVDVGALQLQWRGVAAAVGELFEGDGYATSFETGTSFRYSPGYRNVSVLECDDVEDLGRRIAPLGVHLKALGVAGDLQLRSTVARSLPAPLCPAVAEVGNLQTPAFDAVADGEHPALPFLRFIDLA